MRPRLLMVVLGVAVATALAPAPAQARDAIVHSFDGTPIVTHFFPAAGLQGNDRAPTIMVGHGWGSSGEPRTRPRPGRPARSRPALRAGRAALAATGPRSAAARAGARPACRTRPPP